MKNLNLITKVLICLSLLAGISFAQSLRSLNNDGVEFYENKKFSDAEVSFKKALEKNFDKFEGHFNLGDALFKQERFEEAIKSYQNALSFAENKKIKSGVFHNIGNSLLKSKKLKESIEAYKNSLKLNPADYETKYNLSYALELLKQQQKQQKNQQNKDNKDKNQKDKKDKNKDKKNDQNKDKNKDQKDQNKDQQNKNDQNKDQQNKDKDQQKNQNQNQQQKQQKPQPNKISKSEAQRILNALKNNESDLQKKLRAKKGKVVKKEKDW